MMRSNHNNNNASSTNWISKVRRRLLQHLKDGCTTDLRIDSVRQIPVHETYLNPKTTLVAKHAPYLVCPSILLPPGHAIATFQNNNNTNNHQTPPIIVYRDNDKDQSVHAFINQCRHRGSPLLLRKDKQKWTTATTETTETKSLFSTYPLGKTRAFICPYHGWTYNATTGKLVGIPGYEKGFSKCFNRDENSLLPVPICVEKAGSIWVSMDPNNIHNNQVLSFWNVDQVDAELSTTLNDDTFHFNNNQMMTAGNNNHNNNDHNNNNDTNEPLLIGYRIWDNIPANWQLLVETFLESYHVRNLHRTTLNKVAHSNIMVTDQLDQYNLRMTVPLLNFDTNHQFDDDDDNNNNNNDNYNNSNKKQNDDYYSNFFGQTTTTYFLFPNTAITIFKRFILFLSIEPMNETTSHIRSWGIKRKRRRNKNDDHDHNNIGSKENDKTRTIRDDESINDSFAVCRRDFDNVIIGIEEDWDCAVNIQSGLLPVNNDNNPQQPVFFNYGRFEGNNVQFLDSVQKISNSI